MTTIEDVKNAFKLYSHLEIVNQIQSYCVFGSLARNENLSATSDLDTVLVTKKALSFDELMEMSKVVRLLDSQLNIKIDNVIVTQDEIFNILSPTMLLNVYCDGTVVFGDDLIEVIKLHLNAMDEIKLYNGLLSTLSLKRHWMRKFVLNLDSKEFTIEDLSFVTKAVIHRARDYTRFFVDPYIKSLDQSIEAFEASSLDDSIKYLPREFYKIKQANNYTLDNLQCVELSKKAFNFVEYITMLCENKYKEVSGDNEIILKVF